MDKGGIYGDLELPAAEPGTPPYTVVNAVSTLDGRATLGGKSTPLGGETDRLVMRNIRCAVDAVLVGAGTLRRENLDLGVPDHLVGSRLTRGLAAQPLQVVLKGRSPLPPGRRLYETAGDRLLMIVPDGYPLDTHGVPPGFRHRSVSADSGRAWPRAQDVLRLLGAEFGIRRLLIEGGPAVNRSFFAHGQVAELFLTLAPNVIGEQTQTTIVAGGAPLPKAPGGWRLLSAHADTDSNLFLRYAAPSDSPNRPTVST